MKIIKYILTFISGLYLIVAPAYLTHLINQMNCRSINIDLNGSSDNKLITENEINNLVNRSHPSLIGSKIKVIRTCDIENRIKQQREIRKGEVYFTIDGTLRIYVVQRNPVMRVITGDGDYFIDDEGVLVRKRKLYTPRLHVVGGHITISRPMLEGVSILDTSIRRSVLKDIFPMINYIRNDSFWNAQIDQIWVDRDGEIDLIPRAGHHIVHLGTTENFIEKLDNLEAFYTEILPVAGWNAYKRINLKYKGQIVCNKNQ